MQKIITEQFDEAQKALQDKTIEPSGLVRINAPVFLGNGILRRGWRVYQSVIQGF